MNRSFSFFQAVGAASRRGVLLAVPAWFFLAAGPGQAAKGEWVSQGRGAIWKPAETSVSGSKSQRVSKSKSKGKGKTGSRKRSGRSVGSWNSPASSTGIGSGFNSGATGSVVILPGGSGGGNSFTGGGNDVIVGGGLGSGGLISGGGLTLGGGTGSTTLGGGGVVATTGGGLQSGTTVLNLNPASTETLYSELGVLVINGNNSAARGAITINTGEITIDIGTTLDGLGSLGGMVINSGTIAPGNSPGTLANLGVVGFDNTSVLNFELSGTDQTVGGGVNDLFTGTTNLTLNGTLNVSEPISGTFMSADLGDSRRVFENSGTFTYQSLPAGLSFALDTAVPGQVNLVVVPEPGAAGLLALAGGVLAGGRRRRTE